MEREKKWGLIAGGAAGLVNGLFGGGGGMVLVPLLREKCELEPRQAFATSVAIILPLCALSSIIYLFQGSIALSTAFPYLLGGTLGGLLGGKLFRQVNMVWLRRGFGLLLLYSGIKAVFFH